MHKNIFVHKKKPTLNPSLHEGLLLLIYYHFKAQSRSKTSTQAIFASKEMASSNFSSDTDDVQSISSEDEDANPLSGKKAKVFEKKSPFSTKAPCKKSPRGTRFKISGQGAEEYNEEGDDMEIDEENKEEEDVNREELVAKK